MQAWFSSFLIFTIVSCDDVSWNSNIFSLYTKTASGEVELIGDEVCIHSTMSIISGVARVSAAPIEIFAYLCQQFLTTFFSTSKYFPPFQILKLNSNFAARGGPAPLATPLCIIMRIYYVNFTSYLDIRQFFFKERSISRVG